LSAENEDWLDHGLGNPIDEQRLCERLRPLAAAGALENHLAEDPKPFGFELKLLLSKLRYKLRLKRMYALTTQPITNFFSHTSARAIPIA